MDLTTWRYTLSNATQGTKAGLQAVVDRVRAEVEERPEAAAAAVRRMDWVLRRWGQVLTHWRALVERPEATAQELAAYNASVGQLTQFSTPFYGDMQPLNGVDARQARAVVDRAPIGLTWVPVIVLGGFAVVGIVGTSWALAHRADAEALLRQAEVESEELAARLEAMRGGTVLQNSTLRPTPQAPAPGGGGGGGGEGSDFEKAAAAGLALATVFGIGGAVLWIRS